MACINSSVDGHSNLFLRARGGTPYKKKEQTTSVAQALINAATAFASAISPRVVSSNMVSGVGTSPAKVIESFTNS